MTKEELGTFYDKLAELTEYGTEGDVRAYINEKYPQLPKDIRDELLVNALLTAVQDKVDEERAILQIQEQGLAAARILEEAEAKMEREGLTN